MAAGVSKLASRKMPKLADKSDASVCGDYRSLKRADLCVEEAGVAVLIL